MPDCVPVFVRIADRDHDARLTFDYNNDGFLPPVSYAPGFDTWGTVKSVVASNDAVAVCTVTSCTAPSATWPSATYTWDTGNTIETATSSQGHQHSVLYDANHRVSELRNAAGTTILTLTYDASNRVSTAARAGADTWGRSRPIRTARGPARGRRCAPATTRRGG